MTPPSASSLPRKRTPTLVAASSLLVALVAIAPVVTAVQSYQEQLKEAPVKRYDVDAAGATPAITMDDPETAEQLGHHIPGATPTILVLDDGSTAVTGLLRSVVQSSLRFVRVDLTKKRQTITPHFLAHQVGADWHASFVGTVWPSRAPKGLLPGEISLLHQFSRTFQARELHLSAPANSTIVFSGAVDDRAAKVVARTPGNYFSYLKPEVPFIDNNPATQDSVVTLWQAQPGTTIYSTMGLRNDGTGVFAASGKQDGIDHFWISLNEVDGSVSAWDAWGRGLMRWLSQGLSLSHARAYVSMHIDDTLLGNYPMDNEDVTLMMNKADVDVMVNWQQRTKILMDHYVNPLKSASSKDRQASELAKDLISRGNKIRWGNHTFSHTFFGCERIPSKDSWTCSTDEQGRTRWLSAETISEDIRRGVTWAAEHNIPVDPSVLVTGEHSGLRKPPQMPHDNPNLAIALNDANIDYVASDAGEDYGQRRIGNALTVPRWSVPLEARGSTFRETAEHLVRERRKKSGAPPSSTPLTEAQVKTTIQQLVNSGSSDLFGRMAAGDPRPFFAHQNNIMGDRELYPFIDKALAKYTSTFAANAPLINPTMRQAGDQLRRSYAWFTAKNISASYQSNGLVVHNGGETPIDVPITGPTGTRVQVNGDSKELEAYGGSHSGWVTLPPGQELRVTIPTPVLTLRTSPTWAVDGPSAVQPAVPAEVVPANPPAPRPRPSRPVSIASQPSAPIPYPILPPGVQPSEGPSTSTTGPSAPVTPRPSQPTPTSTSAVPPRTTTPPPRNTTSPPRATSSPPRTTPPPTRTTPASPRVTPTTAPPVKKPPTPTRVVPSPASGSPRVVPSPASGSPRVVPSPISGPAREGDKPPPAPQPRSTSTPAVTPAREPSA